MKNEEWEKFKEFILNKTQHLENNIIKINPGAMDTKLNDVICKLERYSERLNQIEIIANKDKVITDGVHDLQTWKNEARQQISYHDVKLIGISRDLKDAIAKYDKIYLDNLFLPGVIGEHNCKFKNMREFIEVRRQLKIVYNGEFEFTT